MVAGVIDSWLVGLAPRGLLARSAVGKNRVELLLVWGVLAMHAWPYCWLRPMCSYGWQYPVHILHVAAFLCCGVNKAGDAT